MYIPCFLLIIVIPQISFARKRECGSKDCYNPGGSGDHEIVYSTSLKDCIRKVGVSKPSYCSVMDDEMQICRNNAKHCKTAKDCREIHLRGYNKSGIYLIQPDEHHLPFRVYCEMSRMFGGLIEIQKRVDGSVDFFREWRDYKHGFGDLLTEFWLGLRKIHRIIASRQRYKLVIKLRSIENDKAIISYDDFKIDVEANGYKLFKLGNFYGTTGVGNSLKKHLNKPFSTKDVDQDDSESKNCAQIHKGAWWYANCYESNLNGKYTNLPVNVHQGIVWAEWKGRNVSLKGSKMLLIPVFN